MIDEKNKLIYLSISKHFKLSQTCSNRKGIVSKLFKLKHALYHNSDPEDNREESFLGNYFMGKGRERESLSDQLLTMSNSSRG